MTAGKGINLECAGATAGGSTPAGLETAAEGYTARRRECRGAGTGRGSGYGEVYGGLMRCDASSGTSRLVTSPPDMGVERA